MIDCLIAVLLFVTAVMLPFRSIGIVTARVVSQTQGRCFHAAYLVRAHLCQSPEVSNARMPTIANSAAHAVHIEARDCLGCLGT